jgi:hypothetical protein
MHEEDVPNDEGTVKALLKALIKAIQGPVSALMLRGSKEAEAEMRKGGKVAKSHDEPWQEGGN